MSFKAPPNCSTGYVPRDYSKQPLGSVPCTRSFDLELIPRSEWKSRIDYRRENKIGLLNLVKQSKEFVASYQNGYPYCWMHAVINAMMANRLKEGQPFVFLSATAPAAKIKNFREQGGNTWDGIPFAAEHGIPTDKSWPQNSLDRKHDNESTWNEAKSYRLDEWLELEPNNFDQKMTCLLNDIPVVAGYSHWGHMVCDLEPTYRESRGRIEYGVTGLNSWGPTWGPNGDGTYELWGQKAISFDQAAPATTTVAA